MADYQEARLAKAADNAYNTKVRRGKYVQRDDFRMDRSRGNSVIQFEAQQSFFISLAELAMSCWK